MKYVIHKFVLVDHVTTIPLEVEAEVLYADRDSRLQSPAIWVRRQDPPPLGCEGAVRMFRWVATGQPFEAPKGARMLGLARLNGERIFHVFEVPAP